LLLGTRAPARLIKRLGVLGETNLRTEVLAALRFQLLMTD
jgi:hypothetical protein